MSVGSSVEWAPTDPADPALSLLDRLQPLLLIGSIGVGLAVAKILPELAEGLGPAVSAGVFALIYLAMLGVDANSVTKAFTQRRLLATAVVLNFIVNPIAAWLLGEVFLGAEPDMKIGLILFLVTPCIGWYLVFTELAGGDTGLGVSLLGVNVVLQILLLPLYLWLFTGTTANVELSTIFNSVALFLVLPALAAATTRWGLGLIGRTVDDIEARIPLSAPKSVALIVVITAMFASEADTIFDNPAAFVYLIAPLTIFFFLTFVIAVAVGRALDFPYEQTALLAFTTTSRNSEASLAIAATAFTSPLVSLAVVMGPVIELPLLVVMVRTLIGYRHRLTQPVRRGASDPGRAATSR